MQDLTIESTTSAADLGFAPTPTPAYSLESKGMAEALVNTLKRDHVHGADLGDADPVICCG